MVRRPGRPLRRCFVFKLRNDLLESPHADQIAQLAANLRRPLSPGMVGRPGRPGAPGKSGVAGSIGHPGSRGPPGYRGLPGELGDPGPRGNIDYQTSISD